jgi:glyoxylase-like metal-dependent hydrolase (beta-lactamase superfamily II)
MTQTVWQVRALRYAVAPRVLRDVLLGGLSGPEGDAEIGVAYHVFVVHRPGAAFVVDTGADKAALEARGRTLLQPVQAGLDALGITPGKTGAEIIQTHLHWDHAGNHDLLPGARVWLQRREMAYAATTGLSVPYFRAGYDVADIAAMARRIAAGQVTLLDGEASPAPGITLHRVGGHTDGLMLTRVLTRKGWMVLAGDVVAFRANLQRRTPFPHLFHVADALAGFDTALALAGGTELVIPSHDPAVTPEPITRLD